MLICFACGDVEVLNGENGYVGALTSRSPRPAFDDALKSAGIPLLSE